METYATLGFIGFLGMPMAVMGFVFGMSAISQLKEVKERLIKLEQEIGITHDDQNRNRK